MMDPAKLYEVYRATLMRVGVVLPRWELVGEDEKEAWHDVASAALRERVIP